MGRTVGFDGDGHRLRRHGRHERRLGVLLHVREVVRRGGSHRLAALGLARDGGPRRVAARVRVVVLGAQTAVGRDERERIVHQPAVAPM